MLDFFVENILAPIAHGAGVALGIVAFIAVIAAGVWALEAIGLIDMGKPRASMMIGRGDPPAGPKPSDD